MLHANERLRIDVVPERPTFLDSGFSYDGSSSAVFLAGVLERCCIEVNELWKPV